MRHIVEVVKGCFAALGAYLGYFIGRVDGLILTLICFVTLDYITGVICAAMSHTLNSEVGYKGLFRKVMIFVLVGVANLIDLHVINGDSSVIRTAVIFYYLSNEGISILENAGNLGLPIPNKLKDILEQIKKDE